MLAKRCPKCLKGHPEYFRVLPLEAKVCPNCGTKLEEIEIKDVPDQQPPLFAS